jgi:hypothetical protein
MMIFNWVSSELAADGPCNECDGGPNILTMMFVNKVSHDQTHLRLCQKCLSEMLQLLDQSLKSLDRRTLPCP